MTRTRSRARQGVYDAVFGLGIAVPFLIDLLAPLAAITAAIVLAWGGRSAWEAVFLASTAYCLYTVLAGWLTQRLSTPVKSMPIAPLPGFVSFFLLLIAHSALGDLPPFRTATPSDDRDPTVPGMAFRLWLLVSVIPTTLVAILQAAGIWLIR